MAAPALLLLCCLAFVSVAAVWDFRTGHIPNWLTLGGLGVGFVLHVAVHLVDLSGSGLVSAALAGVFNAMLGVFLCGLPPYVLFRMDAMGGGDVKLLAAVGAFVGPTLGLELELSAFVAMALFAPIRLAYEGKLLAVLGNTLVLIANPFLPKARRREVPRELMTAIEFGPAVFVANVVVVAAHWMDR
ncbi:MAG TPA: A24 family peptidase [Polyangiaceae bacterium]|nr:A24 family peptidase [Polyangiaceae bacterium]